MANKQQLVQQDEAVAVSFHGDILEFIFTYVPLIHLVHASRVSKSWKRTVSTSLRHFNKIKPWLILHSQSTRSHYSFRSHAFDPRSHVWIQIQQQQDSSSVDYISALRSSPSSLLYMLSPSKFSFSFDPLHLTWHHIDAPHVWRADPVVAVVGHRVVIAGGGCDFEDDPLAVEMYDSKTCMWDTCESMPVIFKDSASSTWLSVAVNGDKMYVAEKSSGVAYGFDPKTKSWHGPYSFRPDSANMCNSFIGFANDSLILIGFIGNDEEGVNGVKLWELNGASFELCREIGEMPEQLVEKLRDVFSMSSAVVHVISDFVYITNSLAPEEVFFCDLSGGECSWSSVRNVAVNDKSRVAERLVFTCANVELGDLHTAIVAEGRQFSVI